MRRKAIDTCMSFAAFCKAYSAHLLSWDLWTSNAHDFFGRISTIPIKNGCIAKILATPFLGRRSQTTVGSSSQEGAYVCLVVAGTIKVEQANRRAIAAPGELVIYSSTTPAMIELAAEKQCEQLVLFVPASALAHSRAGVGGGPWTEHCPTVLKGGAAWPLLSCLNFTCNQFHHRSPIELAAMFDACVSLIPVALNAPGITEGSRFTYMGRVFARVLEVIHANLADPDLSPAAVAQDVQISTRYLHKLFALNNMTFCSYINEQRLENIARDLGAYELRDKTIMQIALSWGVGDISGFNRRFKRRYGISPGQARASFAQGRTPISGSNRGEDRG